MSLEDKITELITSDAYLALGEQEKASALLGAIAEFAQDNAEQKRKNEFYKARDSAREINEGVISDLVQAKREEFNTKWQAYEDNDYTIDEE